MSTTFLIFFVSLIILWLGSGLALSAVMRISRIFKIPDFLTSFLILGFFTSLTEITVGVSAIRENQPEIFVGNLIGSSVVIFLLIIPLLTILANGIKLNHDFSYKDLVMSVIVIGMPAVLALDSHFSLIDAIVCLIVYANFFYSQGKKSNTLVKIIHLQFSPKSLSIELVKILAGMGMLFYASNLLVDQTVALGEQFNTSTFVISLLVISIGTNIPELSIAVRAVLARKNDIALGNYIGSSAVNTFVIGLLTVANRNDIILGEDFALGFVIFILGLGAFLYVAKSKREISRPEGMLLMAIYIMFILLEVSK